MRSMFDIPIDIEKESESKTLEDTIGNNEQDKKEIKKQMGKLFGVGNEDAPVHISSDKKSLALKLICPRYKNLYIFNKAEVQALSKSIKESGLISPITVINIDQYLDPNINKDIGQGEREYYERMRKEYGCEYFISSGHKRYRATLCNLLGTYIDSDKMIIKFLEDIKSGRIKIDINDKRYFIDCIVGNPNSLAEDKISKRTNGLARTLTAFERVMNAVDSIARVKKLNDTQIYATTAEEIQKYIKETDGVEIELKTISNNWSCIRKIKDAEILDLISKGLINTKQIKSLTPIYDLVMDDKEAKNALIKSAKAGHLDMDDIREMVKPSKKKAGRAVAVKFSKAEILDILHQVKMKTMKIDDAIALVERRKK